MKLHTASEVISLLKKLESDSAGFYRELAGKYSKENDLFLSLAKENEKNIVQVERAYYGVITDAIEGCYAFELESDGYHVASAPSAQASYTQAVDEAINIEETLIRFYTDAAEQCDTLMADLPRAFKIIARKRAQRVPKLKELPR